MKLLFLDSTTPVSAKVKEAGVDSDDSTGSPMSLKFYNIVTLYLNVLKLCLICANHVFLGENTLQSLLPKLKGKNTRVAVTAKKSTKPISETFKRDTTHRSIMLEVDQAASGKTFCGDYFLCNLCLKVVFAASKLQTPSDTSEDDTEKEEEMKSEGQIIFLSEKPLISRHVNLFFCSRYFSLTQNMYISHFALTINQLCAV